MSRWHLNEWVLMGSTFWVLGCFQPLVAQVIPDDTLPAGERSLVTGNPNFQIDGGARRGGNLFHSFNQFFVPTGGSAFFNSAADVQNILTRVTGGSVSNIDGLIQANGTANLFLLNPNGIIFGQNASLNIGGSFVATTANAMGFGNLGFFSASNPEVPSPLLTINPSALLFNQITTAPIQNNSTGPAGTTLAGEEALGLRVPDGQSLLLIGGNISMDGGRSNAFGGRVELGGLAGGGTVGLNVDGKNLSLSFPNSVERSDIFLSNGALVNVTASDGGSIAINAQNLEMTAESELLAGIDSGLGSDNSQAGNISVNATGAITLNNRSEIANQVQEEANGQGGDVNISASTLRLEGGAQVSAITYGAGKGGSLSVDAQDVQIIGTSANNRIPSALVASAQANSTGDAGDLTIRTNTLLIQDGAQVYVSTSGASQGGSLSVDAQDVQITGTSANNRIPSVLGASAQANSTGDAGDLTIRTNTLLIQDGAQVYVSASGAGQAGSLSVDAQDVQIIGTSADNRIPSALGASAQANSTGDAGELTLKTNTMLVQDGAEVSVESVGTGTAGNLFVDANQIYLDNGGRFRADTSGGGGNINLRSPLILLRNGSSITTNATGSKISGGNINIDTDNLVAVPTQNSDISANSADFRGGNVTVRANGIFGIEFREQLTPLSDITATGVSSEFSGTVTLNTPDIDPSRGLTNLPTEVVDAFNQIDQTCAAGGILASRRNRFVVTGSGGLPDSPDEALSPDTVWEDLRFVENSKPSGSQPTVLVEALAASNNRPTTNNRQQTIVEAQGWALNQKGEVVLTDLEPTVTPPSSWQKPVACPHS